jgi:hypothetical protein
MLSPSVSSTSKRRFLSIPRQAEARSVSLTTLLVAAALLSSACGKADREDEDQPSDTETATGGAEGSTSEVTTDSSATGGETSENAPEYLKAENAGTSDLFGVSLAFSADGNTLVVGANGESSAGQGVTADPSNNDAPNAGAVYVFVNVGGTWQEQAYLKAENSDAGDGFGGYIALSADGNTLAVGAPYESGSAHGVDGADDNEATESGAVYMFSRSGNAWQREAYLKSDSGDEYDMFGFSLALSADGNTLAIGAEAEDGGSPGVIADPTDKSAPESGAVYVFSRSAGAWAQSAYLKADNPDVLDHFGGAVALDAAGSTLAVGAYWEDGAGAGNNSDGSDNAADNAGAVYLFEHDGSTWRQLSYLKPSSSDGLLDDNFGSSVSLSANGSLLAVGAPGDGSPNPGINADRSDQSLAYAGAAYVFARTGETFEQQVYLKASAVGDGDEFGNFLRLSSAGDRLVVGAALEASSATGLNGNDQDDSAPEAGAAYLFGSDNGTWEQITYLKAPNSESGDRFAWSLALASERDVLAVGATRESSAATGLGGDQTDNSAYRAGAVYVYSDVSALSQ